MSVVCHTTEQYSTIVGNPAKVEKKRSNLESLNL